MNRREAALHMKQAFGSLRRVDETIIFDEWVLVEIISKKWKVLAYQSNRKDAFRANFHDDVSSLKMLDPTQTHIGEFCLSHEGVGTKFDAYLCAGENVFFLFNHTVKTIDELIADPAWEEAQKHFVELQEHFMIDPVM